VGRNCGNLLARLPAAETRRRRIGRRRGKSGVLLCAHSGHGPHACAGSSARVARRGSGDARQRGHNRGDTRPPSQDAASGSHATAPRGCNAWNRDVFTADGGGTHSRRAPSATTPKPEERLRISLRQPRQSAGEVVVSRQVLPNSDAPSTARRRMRVCGLRTAAARYSRRRGGRVSRWGAWRGDERERRGRSQAVVGDDV